MSNIKGNANPNVSRLNEIVGITDIPEENMEHPVQSYSSVSRHIPITQWIRGNIVFIAGIAGLYWFFMRKK